MNRYIFIHMGTEILGIGRMHKAASFSMHALRMHQPSRTGHLVEPHICDNEPVNISFWYVQPDNLDDGRRGENDVPNYSTWAAVTEFV